MHITPPVQSGLIKKEDDGQVKSVEDGGEEEDSTDSFDSTFRDCRGLWLGVGRGTGGG